jgi:Zn-dependent metalloprotease
MIVKPDIANLSKDSIYLAISLFGEDDILHTGLIYSFQDKWYYLHLKGPANFVKEELRSFKKLRILCLAKISVHKTKLTSLLLQINAFFTRHSEKNNDMKNFEIANISYGFNVYGNNKEIGNKISKDDGFTCVTIILYLLRKQKIKILDINTWPNIDDAIREKQLIQLIKAYKKNTIDKSTFENQVKIVKSTLHKRVSPQELFISVANNIKDHKALNVVKDRIDYKECEYNQA